jgi:prolyl oligopeptidase
MRLPATPGLLFPGLLIIYSGLLAAETTVSAVVASTAEARENPAEALHQLLRSEWQRSLAEDPIMASTLGDLRYNSLWPDLSQPALERRHQADADAMQALLTIPRVNLSPLDQINYDLFLRNLQNRLDIYAFGRRDLYGGNTAVPMNQRNGLQTAYDLAESLRFRQLSDYQDWIARLRGFGTYADQTIALFQASIDRDIAQPRIIVERIRAQLPPMLVSDPGESPFYLPFREMPADIEPGTQTALRAEASAAIEQVVLPAYRRFAEFLDRTYLPRARPTDGVWDEPDGAAFYANRVAYFTTTELTPGQIHELGLAEVSRIRAEMEAVIADLGFDGSFDEFLTFLRTDPRFYHETPEALFDAYLATSKRIDPELVKLFGRLPRMPYGVRPIPDAVAPHTTTAYYSGPADDGTRAGFYYVNLYRPETRPIYEIEVLTVHEAMPGHHLENALTMELGQLPDFRRHDYLTAFSEGWALYSESLGAELGLYKDPYSHFGQLTYEMWRAVRLVIDTGIHAFGWDRQRAIEFFRSNAAKTEADIVNEVDRYISWPGQALAYKIGELKIKELRAEAESRLGERFDIRAFHDQLLAQGPVPLALMASNTRAWIDSQSASR